MRRRRRNQNQRRQIIKNGWADYEGEVIKSEDIHLEQDCPKETVALNQMWKEKRVVIEEKAPPEPPSTLSSESQDDGEHKSRSEDLKTPNTVPKGKLGSYPFFPSIIYFP